MQGEQTTVESFLSGVCQKIRCAAMHAEIRAELLSHIEDAKQEYFERGYSADDAEKLALNRMGDAAEVGVRLDRIHRPKMDWITVLLVSILVLIGISVEIAVLKMGPYWVGRSNAGVVVQYAVSLVLGLAVFVIFCLMDYRKLLLFAFPLFCISIAVFTISILLSDSVLVPNAGTLRSIASRVLLLVIPSLIFSFAGCLERLERAQKSPAKFAAFSLILLAVCYLHRLNWTTVMSIAFLVLLWQFQKRRDQASKPQKRRRWIYGVLLAPLLILPVLSYTLGIVGNRNSAISQLGIFSGVQLWGRSERIVQLDLSSTFNNLLNQFGVLSGVLLALFLLLFAVQLILDARTCKNRFFRTLSTGVVTVLLAEITLSLGNIGAFGHFTDFVIFNMPFASYDSVGFVMNMALLGMLLSCRRRRFITPSDMMTEAA